MMLPTVPPQKTMIVVVVTIFFSVAISAAGAFSPEIFNQVIVQLGITGGQIQIPCADELAFAAANLLDGTMGQRRNIPLLTPPATGKEGTGSSFGGGSIRLPKLAPSVYDDEARTAPGALDQTNVPGLLDLTPQEEELIRLILEVRNEYSPRTTIRIAGGWVRDKLIYGKDTPSRDVDLVLSDTSGKEFAEKVCKYLEETHEDGAMNGVRIQQSPSSSKGAQAEHLETASLTISGFEVDFCRLRYERYDKDSRIPVASGVASAVEDAWRRDLTINSLYYNINTNQVEDWTERGIKDLILQTINTPLRPLGTLLQDPTRILRAIRFAAQLSFDMSPELIRAARDDRVRSALQYKVSRDVIGNAIDDMLGTRARDPSRGIQLLMATSLIDVVFPLEGQDNGIYQVGLEHLSRTQSLVTRIFLQSRDLDWDITKRRILWYAAFLKPVYELMSTNSNSKRERRKGSVFYQLLDNLKRPKTDMQLIESVLKGVTPLQTMMNDDDLNDDIQFAIRSGAILKDISPQSPEWEQLSELRWMIYNTFEPVGVMWKEAAILALASSQKNLDDCVRQYTDLISLIDHLHLGKILQNKARPLLNGSQIQQRALQGKIDGRDFKRVVQAMEEWQIRNVFHDLESIDDDTRSLLEAQLIDYLVTTFPEYAKCASTQ